MEWRRFTNPEENIIMKAIPGIVIGLVLFGFLFYAVDEGLMKTQGLRLFPDKTAEEKAPGGH